MKTFGELKEGDELFITDLRSSEIRKKGEVIITPVKYKVDCVSKEFTLTRIWYWDAKWSRKRILNIFEKDYDKEVISDYHYGYKIYSTNEECVDTAVREIIESEMKASRDEIEEKKEQIQRHEEIISIYEKWLDNKQNL